MVLGGGRKQQKQQQSNPLEQKRLRQQQQQQQPPSSSSEDDDDFDDEGDFDFNDGMMMDEGAAGGANPFAGLSKEQMMQMMMNSRQGRMLLGAMGGGGDGGMEFDEEDDEFDGMGDFPLPDDEGDDGFDYDGFDAPDDDEEDFEGDFDEEDEEDDERIKVLDSDDENNNNKHHKPTTTKKVNENDQDVAEGDVNVDFSVDNMMEDDVPKVSHHLENYFPDPEKATVDLDAFAKTIFNKGVGTSVVLASQQNEEDDDEEEDEESAGANLDDEEDPEQQFYGVLSLISSATVAQNGQLNKSLKTLESSLFKEVLSNLSGPTSVHPISVLTSSNNGKSALIVSELFSQLPPQLIARLYSCFVEEVEQAKATVPEHVIFLSKVMPANAKSEDKTPLTASAQSAQKYSNEKSNGKPKKRGPRVEEIVDADDSIEEGNEFVTFLRFEEDLFYRNRDSVGTQVARGRFNNDPTDPRRCLCYAVSWKKFKAAVEELSILIQ